MDDQISRQDAIDYCYQLINVEHQQGSDEMNYGQERVNQTETILHHLEFMPSTQSEQRWIPCSERLPEQYGDYLISYRTDDFESDIGTFDPDRINLDTGEWSACDANGFYWVASKGLEVIAWMPIPEPYAERRKEGGK